MIGLDGEDNMEVKNRKLSSITAYGKNAKKHDKTQINNVAESIKQYGFVQPIVIDRDGVIVIGHCRAMAAKKLGMEEVPCVCVDDLTPEQVNALRLVDNKSNESNWDFACTVRVKLKRMRMSLAFTDGRKVRSIISSRTADRQPC